MFWLFEITPESYKTGEISLWSEGMIYKMIVITLIEFKSPGIQEELSMLKLINFFLMLSSSVSSSCLKKHKKPLHKILREGIVVSDRILIENKAKILKSALNVNYRR